MNKVFKAIAKTIRILFLPPVVVSAFLLLVYRKGNPVGISLHELVFSLFSLALFPVLAYPVSWIRPVWRSRNKQRKIAFLFSGTGYLLGFTGGLLSSIHPLLLRILGIYLSSFCLLLCCNIFHVAKASGHACSIAGALILCILLFGRKWCFPAAGIFCSVLWASVYLNRHTVQEFLLGSAASVLPALLLHL